MKEISPMRGNALKTPFTIAHLSDLHLTRREGEKRLEMEIFTPLRGMNATFRQLISHPTVQKNSLLLITGDVTDRGHVEAWRSFWDAVERTGLSERVLVVPGNHDVCCLGARLPGKRRMYAKKDLLKAVAGLALGDQPSEFPWVRTPDERVAIFGINSNNLGNLSLPSNAMGMLGYYQLYALAAKLHQYRKFPVKILALHHSPNIPQRRTARRRMEKPMSILERKGHQIPRDQRRALLLLCISHRVRLVLHGHLHYAEDRRVSGIRIIGAPASTEPVVRAPQEKIHSLGAFQFYKYTVQGKGGRVVAQLQTVCL